MLYQKAQNKASQPLSWENKREVTISRSNILVEADCAGRLVDDACSYLGCILSGIHKYFYYIAGNFIFSIGADKNKDFLFRYTKAKTK